MVSPTINLGLEVNQLRKKRCVKEVEEIDQTTKQNLDRDRFFSSQCFKVLRSLKEHRFGWLLDDLITIKSKLDKNLYKNTEAEFPEDVRLVFSKAIRYNHHESSVYKNAEELKKFFEIRWESVKKKLASEFERQPKKQEASSSSDNFYYTEHISLQTNPVKKQRKTEQGFVFPIPLSPNKALRAATIKIRFADTIVRARYKNLNDESGNNKADVMTRIQKEKQNLERRQIEEKARIEAEIKAPILKLRHKIRLSLDKMEEEAKSNVEEHLVTEKEMVKLCGGSHLARTRWVEQFGLFFKSNDDDSLEEILIKACDDLEEGEII